MNGNVETYAREVLHKFVLAEPYIVKDVGGNMVTVERVIVSCQLERKAIVWYKGRMRKKDGTQRAYAAFQRVYPKVPFDQEWITEVVERSL